MEYIQPENYTVYFNHLHLSIAIKSQTKFVHSQGLWPVPVMLLATSQTPVQDTESSN